MNASGLDISLTIGPAIEESRPPLDAGIIPHIELVDQHVGDHSEIL
jgi:hypothetical protein